MSEGDAQNGGNGANSGSGDSSTGLQSNLGGLLCYLVGFISAVIFVAIEKRDGYVRFHAFQSLATFGGLFALNFVAGFVPVIGAMISLVLAPVGLILWLLLMIKAYQGERYKLPVVGDWAEQQAAP